ncbi:MAG: outer membrane beta-barrel protein [Bacteroidales bacterium]|nr:outer membrane beta-barrel protein [Bacteroidales bacterium]
MKTRKINIFALIAMLVAGFSATAQTTMIKDSKTGEPVMFANIALLRATDSSFVRGTTSDATGSFSLQPMADSCLIRVSAIGYKTLWLSVSNLPSVIHVSPEVTTLAEVTVVEKRPLYAMDGEKNMYNTKEDPSIQTGTTSDALQNAPGVEVDAEGNITLRGSASVEIWINDRPSHMNDEALKQYVKQLPANAIERIEVITNPSARYSTSGGVINIVTNQKVTRNELLCVGVRARTSPNVSPWASYVWANEKVDFNLYVNADWSRHRTYGNISSALYNPTTGDTSRILSHNDTVLSNNIGGYTGLNVNWRISDRTNLASWAGFYPYHGASYSKGFFDYFEHNPLRDFSFNYVHDNNDGLFWGGYAGAWLEHRFDSTGRKISLSLNGNTSNQGGTSYGFFAYRNTLLDTLFRRDYSMNRNPSVGLTVDYAHPLKNDWEIDGGMQASLGGGSLTRTFDTIAGGQYVNVPLRSYEGTEHGTDFHLYATVQKRWGGLTVKAGLRGEWGWMGSSWHYSDGSGLSTVDTSFFVPVPSLHISYQTPTFTSYSISYTRRYENPGQSQLNPFCRYDDYSYETGNPLLRLTYTHNLEAAFNKYVMGFGNIGLNAYWRANTNEIGSMAYAGYAPAYFTATQLVNYTRPENIGSSHTEGIEANITYRPTAMLNVRFNASLFNYGYNYLGFSDSHISWSARLNVWAKLWNRLEVFANAHYSSPRMGLYSMSVANKGVDFGVSSDFYDRRLSVFLNVNDIFGMAQWGENSTAPLYKTTGSYQYDSRFVSLGITWRMGKLELEGKARQGATDNAPTMMR